MLSRVASALWSRTIGEYRSARRPGRVCLFHQHRCGSRVLGTMLDRHPEISWRNEIITHDYQHYMAQKGTGDGWTCDLESVVRRQMRNNPDGWFGCEITTFNLRQIGFTAKQCVDFLDRLGFTHFVILERHNHLRRYISSRLAAANNSWHIQNEQQRKLTSITMPVDNAGMDDEGGPILQQLAHDTKGVQDFVDGIGAHHRLHMVYEQDIQGDPRVAYRKTCEFLGLTPEEIEPSLVRSNPFPVSEMLDNFEEVAEALKGTEYEWMLHDDVPAA